MGKCNTEPSMELQRVIEAALSYQRNTPNHVKEEILAKKHIIQPQFEDLQYRGNTKKVVERVVSQPQLNFLTNLPTELRGTPSECLEGLTNSISRWKTMPF